MGYLLVVLENLRILNKKPESRGDSGLVSLAAEKPAEAPDKPSSPAATACQN
jgi:hypothetical protein